MADWLQVLLSAAFAAGGAYAAVRIELNWLRRDVDRLHARQDAQDERYMDHLRESGL